MNFCFEYSAAESAATHPPPRDRAISGCIPSNDPAERARQLRALNVERQKRIVFDAKKLLKLATEFNAEVARANPESLTAAQIRKLAEIEKIDKDLKENLTATVMPSTDNRSLVDPKLR